MKLIKELIGETKSLIEQNIKSSELEVENKVKELIILTTGKKLNLKNFDDLKIEKLKEEINLLLDENIKQNKILSAINDIKARENDFLYYHRELHSKLSC